MSKNVPSYIIKHAEALQRACNLVAKHAEAIEDWVEKQGVDGLDFVCDYHLDSVYEYDYIETLEALENL